MSQLTKPQLETVNQDNFPNNTTGYISPQRLREFNTDVIDSTVNQTIYTANSASFDSRIDSLESFSSSIAIDYINQTELNAATASLSASLTTTINGKVSSSTFTTFSTSVDSRLDDLVATKANLAGGNSFSGSQSIFGDVNVTDDVVITGQLTASVIKTPYITGSEFRSATGTSYLRILESNNFTTEDLTIAGVPFTVYSASIASSSAFIANYTGQTFNLFSASVDSRLDSLESFSSSLTATYATDVELSAVSSSIMSNFNTFSASQYKADSSSFDSRITTNSASFASFSSSQYKTDSSSFDSRINAEVSASTFFSGTQYKNDSSSFDSRLDLEEFKSTTFATTGSNTFIGNQTITGNVYISSSNTSDVIVNGQIFVSSSAIGASTAPKITISGSAGTTTINRNSISTRNATTTAELNPIAIFAANLTTYDEIGFTLDPTGSGVTGWTNGPAIYINNTALDTYPAVFGFQKKENYTDGRVTVLTPLIVSASTTISGSVNGVVGNLSVVSSTASIDMSKGNFFTLNIPTGSTTFIRATNIKEGQTVAVKLTQASNSSGSVIFNPSQFKFWSGSAQYNTGSQVTGSTDIFTFVTFDTSSLWTTIVKNLV